MNKFEFFKEELVEDLKRIGIEKGDIVLVHSSLSSIGYVPGGAETVIDSLIESVGESGTIVVPTITGQLYDSPENPPSFSRDKPCWTGTIPETLRKRKEAYRSLHPTHSVAAIGRLAREITEGHENSLTPCGEGTPFLKIPNLNGKILFLGVTLDSNTTFHAVEELSKLYYHLQPEPTICKIDINGRKIERKFYLHAYGTPRSFGEKERDLLEAGIARVGYIGRARSILVDARKMVEFTLDKLEKDRLYLVKKDSIDLWSIASTLKLLQENKFKSIKINLYVPNSAELKFKENGIVVRGVKMNFFNFYLSEGIFETSTSLKSLSLSGGFNYWIEFTREEKGININVLEYGRPDSVFSF